jgi:hypothetical protein
MRSCISGRRSIRQPKSFLLPSTMYRLAMKFIKMITIAAAMIAASAWSAANADELQDRIKVMKDAVAARHGGVLPDTVSKEDAEAAAQAVVNWRAGRPCEPLSDSVSSLVLCERLEYQVLREGRGR